MAASDITGTFALVLSDGGTSYGAAKEMHDQKIKATIDTVGFLIRSPDCEGCASTLMIWLFQGLSAAWFLIGAEAACHIAKAVSIRRE